MGRELPSLQVVLRDLMNAAIVEELNEFSVLLLQNGGTLRQQMRGANRVLDLVQEHFGEGKRLVVFVFNWLMSDDVQDLTNAAVLVGRIVPAINAINVLQPGRDLQLGIESLPGLIGSTASGVNRALTDGPVLNGRGVVVNAVNRQRTSILPHVTDVLRNADIQKKNVGSNQLVVARPGRPLVRRDGEHIHDPTVGLERRVGNVGGEPAINAVAVEDERVLGRDERHSCLE